MKKNNDWCFVTYPTPLHGPWEWISGLMPYEAYLNAREAGNYQHSNYFVANFNSYEEAKRCMRLRESSSKISLGLNPALYPGNTQARSQLRAMQKIRRDLYENF